MISYQMNVCFWWEIETKIIKLIFTEKIMTLLAKIPFKYKLVSSLVNLFLLSMIRSVQYVSILFRSFLPFKKKLQPLDVAAVHDFINSFENV